MYLDMILVMSEYGNGLERTGCKKERTLTVKPGATTPEVRLLFHPMVLTVAIGAKFNGGNGAHSGHVRIWEWSGSAWNKKGQDLDGEATGDIAGSAVALSSDGTIVAVGAQYNDGMNGDFSGHVRVWQWGEPLLYWKPMGSNASIDGEAAEDYSGNAVALSSVGDVLAIGAYYNDGAGGGNNVGHVRVWRFQ